MFTERLSRNFFFSVTALLVVLTAVAGLKAYASCGCADEGTNHVAFAVEYGAWDGPCHGVSCTVSASYPPLTIRFDCNDEDESYYCLINYETIGSHHECDTEEEVEGSYCKPETDYPIKEYDNGNCNFWIIPGCDTPGLVNTRWRSDYSTAPCET